MFFLQIPLQPSVSKKLLGIVNTSMSPDSLDSAHSLVLPPSHGRWPWTQNAREASSVRTGDSPFVCTHVIGLRDSLEAQPASVSREPALGGVGHSALPTGTPTRHPAHASDPTFTPGSLGAHGERTTALCNRLGHRGSATGWPSAR